MEKDPCKGVVYSTVYMIIPTLFLYYFHSTSFYIFNVFYYLFLLLVHVDTKWCSLAWYTLATVLQL